MEKAKDVDDLLNSLSPERRALLALQALRLKTGNGARRSLGMRKLPRREGGDSFAASSAQQRLCFLQRIEPESTVYNLPAAVRLAGRLDIWAVERSLNEIIRRHESLRTTLAIAVGQVLQVVAPEMRVELPLIDLRHHPDPQGEAGRLAAECAWRPFDLSRGPLLRATLLRLGGEDHVIVFTMHHIVSDAWSTGILIKEVTELYDAFSRGEPSPLAELTLQYADYSAWQREWLQGDDFKAQMEYWKKQLAGSLPVVELPSDRPRQLAQTSRGATYKFTLSKPLSDELKKLSQREGVTLFMLLVAAFKVLLHRYTQQEDILVGTPIAGRTRGEIEGLIGFFVNTLILRTNLSGNPSFGALLARVRQVAVGAYANEGVPFEKIVQELQPERYLNRSPMLPVMFVLQNAPMESLRLSGLTLSPFDAITRTQASDELYLSIFEAEQGLTGSVEYKTDLFDEATIARMMGHYARLLEAIVDSVDTPIQELAILTEPERRLLLDEWNQTEREFPPPECVHQFFEIQAERSPCAIALVCGDEQLSYRELNRRADELAHNLRDRGVGPESLVAIMMNRGIDMVVGVLAIVKAGGAYVPLDPAYPAERLQLMLEDSGAKLLLTQSNLMGAVPGCNAEVLCMDSDWRPDAREAVPSVGPTPDSGHPDLDVSADNGAYVLYTSGLTGRPKGVLMAHRPLVNLIHWQIERMKCRENTRTLQFASLSFDVSFHEIFSTLATGGSLVLIEEATRRDTPALARLLNEQKVNRIFFTFAALQRIAEAVTDGQTPLPAQLIEVHASGEQLQITGDIAKLFDRLNGCVLYNQYGPSEAHVVTSADLGNRSILWPRLPLIGRPISNTEIYILDENFQPVPIGVAGELYIAGTCLARGYLGRPDLTADRFIPHPFAKRPGERLYRTGDLSRYLHNGEIEVLGRLDHQVKVRGYRIELGEIEAALDGHPSISKSLVMAREYAAGEKRLVAYLMGADGEGHFKMPTASELRRFLQSKLPDYMIPSAFVSVREWPLTPSGKINRRALPAPDPSRPELDKAFVAPRTPVEKALADIWSQVLGIDAVGIHDNFLELGGDSITGIQVISRSNRSGLDLTLVQLWQRPTVAELAQLIGDVDLARSQVAVSTRAPSDKRAGAGLSVRAPAAVNLDQATIARLVSLNGEIEDVYPLSHLQLGILFHNLYNPASNEYVEQFSCELKGGLNLSAFEHAWQRVIERHPALRTAFALHGLDEPLQVVYNEVPLPLEHHDWRGLSVQEQRQRFQAILETEGRGGNFQLEKAPLIRLALFQLSDDSYYFIWSFHDIALDGWSCPLILDEVRVLYEAFCRDQEPQIGPAYPYRNFIEWLSLQDMSKAEAFWRRLLEGLRPPVQIRGDRAADGSRQVAESYDNRKTRLSKEKTASLQSFARRHQLTLNTLAQAAWAIVLSRYSGEPDVVFGGVVSGRPADLEGVEAMAGVLVNTLPVRVQVPRDKPLVSWLKGIQSEQVEARQYEFSPLVQINKWSGLAPGQRLFESILAFVNYPEDRGRLWQNKAWSLQKSGYPLFIVVRPEEELLLEVTYSKSRFGAESIDRMLSHLQATLEGMAADDDQRVSQVNILTEHERRHLISAWNDTDRAFPLGACFHQHFQAQVERTPDGVACADRLEQVTYADLNRRANNLALSLGQLGVGPEVIVALLCERSVDFLTAIISIFKVGAAYLPLDPLHPPDRIKNILDTSAPRIVLAADRFMPVLEQALAGAHTGKRLEVLLIQEQARHSESKDNLPTQSGPDSLAYVIFTSGSTGVPKGVMIEQRGMLNHLFAKVEDLSLTAGDVVAQTASQCFDISVWQLLAALLVGGRVEIVDDHLAHHPAQLLDAIESGDVSVFETVPSVLRMMLEEVERRADARPSLPALRWLIPTGEALSPDLCRKWFAIYPRIPLMNAYGPTECSDDVTHYPTDRRPGAGAVSVPIGHAVANMRLYVLDAQLEPVSVDHDGELYVGGIGVGRGYLNDVRQTAEAFMPDPFAQAPGGRLYRTGDLVRRLETGDLEFLGRVDRQIKIRGHRIELGEIEAVLSQHASVKECAVVAREDAPGQKRLVAYVVPGSDSPIASAELRDHVRERLPEYMAPANLILLDRLPLTPNGKIDHKALPAPDQADGKSEAGFVPPGSEAEKALADIWLEVLNLDKVGVTDNFFELGGHSLLATQVFARVQAAFGVEVPLRTIFDKPTIAELASVLEELLLEQLEEMSDYEAEHMVAGEPQSLPE